MRIIQLYLLAAILFCRASNVSAQTWTQTGAPLTNWISVASSADGVHLIAAVGNTSLYTVYGSIYLSSDSGATWLEQTNAPSMNWQTVASSAGGGRLLAIAGSKSSSVAKGGGIFTSADGGSTWISNAVRQAFYQGGISSADGSNLAAVFPFTASTNGGATWFTNASPSVVTMTASADGRKIIGGGISGPLYLSADFGNTWTNALTAGGWPSFASSADASTLVAFGIGSPPHGGIYTSTNGAASWQTNSLSPFTFQFVASSADGKKLALAVKGGGIYTSTNSGFTWTQTGAPNQNWQSIASSADGNSLVAVVYGGGIWVSQTAPSPQLGIASSTTNTELSWLIPSTNFVLQQSSDLYSWVDVTNAPVLNLTNLQNQVTLPSQAGNSFYRLQSP